MTAPETAAGKAASPRMRPEAASALLGKYPPRAVPETWEATALNRAALTGRLLAPPYAETPWSLRQRRLSLRRFLDWLEQHPGDTRQQRWLRAVGVAGGNSGDWRPAAADWLAARGDAASRERLLKSVTLGLGQMIYCEALRPGLAWVIASPVQFPLSRDMPRLRDSGGFARLEECAGRAGISDLSRRRGVEQLSAILAAKGGTLADITVGDCLEFMETRDAILGDRTKGRGNSFYQLLHMMGLLPAGRAGGCGRTVPLCGHSPSPFVPKLRPGDLLWDEGDVPSGRATTDGADGQCGGRPGCGLPPC